MRVVGWVLLTVGIVAGAIGAVGVSDGLAGLSRPYPATGPLLGGSSLLFLTGIASANIGFFLIMFGWLGEKIDRLRGGSENDGLTGPDHQGERQQAQRAMLSLDLKMLLLVGLVVVAGVFLTRLL